MVQIAIMGHGIVGSGVVEVLRHNCESITKRAGDTINIKYILDLRDFPDSPLVDFFVKDFAIIERDPDVKIVVECMGGLRPAYDFVKRCLLSGKSVVTSNKELIAKKGCELLAIAKERNLNLLFEASVGGGIPIIRPIVQCLAANELSDIVGILNGTTNFILTKMVKEAMPFDEALAMAQRLGYAERDPSADIDGVDACRKIAILTSLAFGKHVDPDLVYTEGITGITLTDVAYAEKWGGVIKLIGRVRRFDDDRVMPTVYPAFIPGYSQLSTVDDVFNAIMVRGDAIGDVMFYGRGAGKLPTASAVVADVVDCVKHIKARKYLFWEESEPGYIRDHATAFGEMFVRATTSDYEGALAFLNEKFKVIRVLSEPGEEIAVILTGVEGEIKSTLLNSGRLDVKNLIHVVD